MNGPVVADGQAPYDTQPSWRLIVNYDAKSLSKIIHVDYNFIAIYMYIYVHICNGSCFIGISSNFYLLSEDSVLISVRPP